MSVTFVDVSYSYGSQGTSTADDKALDDVSFTIEDGEFLGIIGHTGSGKSTLIQHINGIIQPTSGKVLVDGLDVAGDKATRKKVRSKVGIVFQYPEYQLFGNTVFEDVSFGPRNMGLPGSEVEARVIDALGQVGLDPDSVLYKSPFDFSGGQRRRIAIAGVLAMRTEVLVLDEPMAGLDPRGHEEILGYIRELHRGGMTVVMVSHDMEDIADCADRVLVMKGGKVFLHDVPEVVFSRYTELREIGLGVPVTTMFAHELSELGFEFDRHVLSLDQLADAIATQVGGHALPAEGVDGHA